MLKGRQAVLMTETDALIVRPLSSSDRAQWGDLWTAYLAFYKTTRPQSLFDTYFERLLGDDPQDFEEPPGGIALLVIQQELPAE